MKAPISQNRDDAIVHYRALRVNCDFHNDVALDDAARQL